MRLFIEVVCVAAALIVAVAVVFFVALAYEMLKRSDFIMGLNVA